MYNLLFIIGLSSNMIGFNPQFKYNIFTYKNNAFVKNIYILPEVKLGMTGEIVVMGIVGVGL